MLSQLSYTPIFPLVGREGLEPSTSRLSSVRSNQLSYQPSSTFNIDDIHGQRLKILPFILFKGGDPAAGSPTATLLRLHPSHRPYRSWLPPRG